MLTVCAVALVAVTVIGISASAEIHKGSNKDEVTAKPVVTEKSRSTEEADSKAVKPVTEELYKTAQQTLPSEEPAAVKKTEAGNDKVKVKPQQKPELVIKAEPAGRPDPVPAVTEKETVPDEPEQEEVKKPEKVLVKEAWDEEVTVMEKEWVTKYICNGKYFDDYDSGFEYFRECGLNGIVTELYPIDLEIEVPVTKVIHHEAEYEFK